MRAAIPFLALNLAVAASLISCVMQGGYGGGLSVGSIGIAPYRSDGEMRYAYPCQVTFTVSTNATDFAGRLRVVRAANNETIFEEEIVGSKKCTVRLERRGVYIFLVESRYSHTVAAGYSLSFRQSVDMGEVGEELGALAFLTPLSVVIVWLGGRGEGAGS